MSLTIRVFVIFVTLASTLQVVVAQQSGIRVITRDGKPIAGPALRYGASFMKREATTVGIEQLSFDRLYDEIMIGFVTGQHFADVLLIPSAWLPDFAPYLDAVPDDLIASEVVGDIHPTYRDALMRWQNQWMALTIDGDLQMGIYRRDLFQDPDNRLAYRERYGRDLEPPETWVHYHQIAEFFNGRFDNQGKRITGTLESYAKGGQRLWYLFSHAAAYANHPDYPGGMFFDPQSMKPSITSPAWKRALREYLDLSEIIGSDTASLDSHQVRSRFSRGEAAMAIDWTDIGVLAAGQESSVAPEDIGFFILPGSQQVWNPETAGWDWLEAPRNVPFLAFGGWIGAVAKTSSSPQKAWSYLAWFASPEHSIRDVTDGTSGINPYRLSHLENDLPWHELMGKPLADEYLSVLRQSLLSPSTIPDLRIPGYRAYMAALDEQIERIVQNEISIDVALKNASVHWEQITDRLGRNSQRTHYRAAMGLPGIAP